jgi:hypothetical protein
MAEDKKKGFLPRSNNIVNIRPTVTDDNITIKADSGYFVLRYYKNRTDFQDMQEFAAFIKGAEKIIRTSDEYRGYKDYLMNEIGLDHCAVMPGVSGEKATIEMHHGPILTLFDYCAIVLDSAVANGEQMSTFKLAKTVLQEHYDNNVQVVMLSKTAHQLFHAGKLFIHPNQAWGNVNNFLERYADGLSREQIETINEYITMSEQNRSTDNGLMAMGDIGDYNKSSDHLLEFEEE